MNIVFSIETDGFLESATRIHCIEAIDLDTLERHSFAGDSIEEGVSLLKSADLTYTHAGQKFGYQVLNKLHNFGYCYESSTSHQDTIILSRLVWADIKTSDKKLQQLPTALRGSHKLEAFAHRLKLQPAPAADYSCYSPQLQQRCRENCSITLALLQKILKQGFSQASVDLEHRFGHIVDKLESYGFSFNVKKAEALYTGLVKLKSETTDPKRLELIANRMSIIGDADKSLLRSARGNRVRCTVISNGTGSGRCVHLEPNVSAIPGKKKWLGEMIRDCFMTPKGWAQVGIDAKAIELVCLAHYLKPFDGGAYIKVVNEGDVHLTNQEAAGLETRDEAKEFIYKLIYGAGDDLLGESFGKDAEFGRSIRESFIGSIKGYAQLKDAIEKQLGAKGYLTGLDGRKLYARALYSALNLILQAASAVLMKHFVCKLYEALTGHGFVWGVDFAFVATIHDELQIECRNEIAEVVAGFAEDVMTESATDFGLRATLTGKAKIGINWSECH